MTKPTLEAVLATAKNEIIADVQARRVPADVVSFAELHDYVDANEYGGFCDDDATPAWIEAFGGRDSNDALPDAYMAFVNEVQDALDKWIKGGGIGADMLLDHLSRHYPDASFYVAKRQDVGVEDYEGTPELLVAIDTDGESILDPLSSECGRFPTEASYYGIDHLDAQLIRAHNRIRFSSGASGKKVDRDMVFVLVEQVEDVLAATAYRSMEAAIDAAHEKLDEYDQDRAAEVEAAKEALRQRLKCDMHEGRDTYLIQPCDVEGVYLPRNLGGA